MSARRGALPASRAAAAGLAFCLLCPGAAAAAPRPLEPYRVDLPTMVLLPDAPGPGAEHTLGPGESILLGRLGLASGAVTSAPIDVVVAGEPIRLRAGAPLMGAHGRGGPLAGLGDPRIFCQRPYIPRERPGGRYYRPGNDPRFPNLVQACFVDRDGDSRLDFAFMAGTSWPEDRVAVPLPQIPYRMQVDIPYGRTELRLVFLQAALLSSGQLSLQVLAGAANLGLTQMQLADNDGRLRAIDFSQRASGDAYPRTISFGAARIEVLAYDPQARTVRIRLLQGFQRAEIVIEAVQGAGATAFRN